MSLTSAGASAGFDHRLVQEAMPEYRLSPDLLDGLLTALPSPPADAPVAWRHARLTRILQEPAALHPLDAAQARIATQIVVTQFLADDTSERSCAPGLTVEQVCRLRRTARELMDAAGRLARTLARRQARTAPFWAPQLAEGFDLDALDAVWCRKPVQQPATRSRQGGEDAPDAAAPGPAVAAVAAARTEADPRDPAPALADAPPDVADTGRSPTARPMALSPGVTTPILAGPTSGSVVTRLDQGPGWTLEVVRPGISGEAGIGVVPGSAT
jgi:hypothetical protein